MPICIAGMHRSGTSMVARLLNLSGVYLGPPSELMPASPANPEGYWEHIYFDRLNDALLEQLGASWDWAPEIQPGWECAPELDSLRVQARELIHRFDAHAPWGWKDPRNSLTIPFWRSLIPNLQVVICLRNPLEVASSLTHRGGSTALFGLRLWQAYNSQLLADAAPLDPVITDYDAYFRDPRAELRRVLALLKLPASDETIDSACSAVALSLRHLTVAHQEMAAVPSDVLQLYLYLSQKAGTYNAFDPVPLPSLRSTAERRNEGAALDAEAVRHALELRVLFLDAQEQILEREKLIDKLRKQIDELSKFEAQRDELYAEIKRMQATRVWQLGNVFWRIKNNFHARN